MSFFKKKTEPVASREEAVAYEHITREFGEGFLFSPETREVSEQEINSYTAGTRENIKEPYHGADVDIFESEDYRRIVRLSLSIPTFDSGDREYDSWHDLYLLQEHNGGLRAVYCKGGYRIAHAEGYERVCQYPESLEKYFL